MTCSLTCALFVQSFVCPLVDGSQITRGARLSTLYDSVWIQPVGTYLCQTLCLAVGFVWLSTSKPLANNERSGGAFAVHSAAAVISYP